MRKLFLSLAALSVFSMSACNVEGGSTPPLPAVAQDNESFTQLYASEEALDIMGKYRYNPDIQLSEEQQRAAYRTLIAALTIDASNPVMVPPEELESSPTKFSQLINEIVAEVDYSIVYRYYDALGDQMGEVVCIEGELITLEDGSVSCGFTDS